MNELCDITVNIQMRKGKGKWGQGKSGEKREAWYCSSDEKR